MTRAAAGERGLVMSALSIPPILADTKTQTRRLLTFQEFQRSTTNGYDWTFRDKRLCWNDVNHERLLELCPYGKRGDRLWIRESWRSWPEVCHEDHAHGEHCKQVYVAYKATPRRGLRVEPDRVEITYLEESTPLDRNRNLAGPWNNPRYMPKWAARILLEIVEVRVEHLQDITDDDARAEGVIVGEMQDAIINGEPGRAVFFNARDAYAYHWNAINGARATWVSNPWVWALTFKRIAC